MQNVFEMEMYVKEKMTEMRQWTVQVPKERIDGTVNADGSTRITGTIPSIMASWRRRRSAGV